MAALLCASAAGAEPVPMKTAWLGEHETFAVWYAKEKGWDKEAGLDISMLRFDSGKAIVEGILAYDWAVAGCGAVPTLTAALSDRIDIIAVANDESAANALYVRADSPILATEGANPAYPAVHGGKESVRGKEILCPKGTSAHYMTAMWLNALGLTEQDVHLKDMTATQALGAFAGGLGDAVALWAPLTYDADAKGFKPAALSRDCGVSQPVLIVANHDYAVKHPNQIEAFLKMYLRAVATLRETPPETLAPDYIRFYESWTGRKLTPELAVQDLRNHPVFTLDEQLALFDDADGKGQLRTWLADIAAFFDGIDMVRQEDRPRLERMNAVTDVYLKATVPCGPFRRGRRASPGVFPHSPAPRRLKEHPHAADGMETRTGYAAGRTGSRHAGLAGNAGGHRLPHRRRSGRKPRRRNTHGLAGPRGLRHVPITQTGDPQR